MRSLLFSRSKKPYRDKLIRAWEGDDAGHVAVRLGNVVIDSTISKGVDKYDYDEWLYDKILVDEIPVIPKTVGMAEQADTNLYNKIGKRKYDIWKIVGFPLLRDIENPDKDICSETGSEWFTDCTGIKLPGRSGRIGVRLMRVASHCHYYGIKTYENIAGISIEPSY